MFWVLTSAAFTILRLLLRHIVKNLLGADVKSSEVGTIYFDTLGRSFGTLSSSSLKFHRSESVVLLLLSLFCFIASIFCSGFLFGHLINDEQTPLINSLHELNDSDIPIFFTYALNRNFYDWLRKQ